MTCKAADRNDSSSASNEPVMYPVTYSPTSSFQLHNMKERSPRVLAESPVCLLEGWCGLLIGWAVWRKVFCIQPEPVPAGPWLALDPSMKVARCPCNMWIYQTWHSPHHCLKKNFFGNSRCELSKARDCLSCLSSRGFVYSSQLMFVE